MSRNATLAAIRALPDMSAGFDTDTGEYRLTFATHAIRAVNIAAGVASSFRFVADRAEAVACYTNDGDDAVATAQAMQERGYQA